MSLWTTAAIILVPWGIRQYNDRQARARLAATANGNTVTADQQPWSTPTALVQLAALVILALLGLSTLLVSPPSADNVFAVTNLPVTAPDWALRRALAPLLISTTRISLESAAPPLPVPADYSAQELLVASYTVLRSRPWLRAGYVSAGTDAFLACGYCLPPPNAVVDGALVQEVTLSYLEYALPGLLGQYAVDAVLLGLATVSEVLSTGSGSASATARAGWRTVAVYAVVAVAGAHAAVLAEVVDLTSILNPILPLVPAVLMQGAVVLRPDLPHASLAVLHAVFRVLMAAILLYFPLQHTPTNGTGGASVKSVLSTELGPTIKVTHDAALATALLAQAADRDMRSRVEAVRARNQTAADRVRRDEAVARERTAAIERLGGPEGGSDAFEAQMRALVEETIGAAGGAP
ncbi:hypothetical protein BC828DRAFT_393420 [Blastocladiella britannica]|nr:hypothetical protein BC828DRAFT_393420 [Blastocladiella britannica]